MVKAAVADYAADYDYSGSRTAWAALAEHMEDSMSKVLKELATLRRDTDRRFTDLDNTVRAQNGRVLKAVEAAPEATVTAWLGRVIYGFNLAWWIRRGLVPVRDHKQYPADPGSPADIELRVAEQTLGEKVEPYDGSQKRGE